MPTKRTRRPGAITSRILLFFEARSSALLGGPDNVAARLLVGVELDEPFFTGFLEEVGERREAIVGVVEAGVTALQGLLHHRSRDLLLGAALRHERFQRTEHQVEALLFLVSGRARRRRFSALFGDAPLLLLVLA